VSCGLRDVAEFERAGKPGVLIVSSAFVEASTDEAEKLGHPELRRVFVPHPVQDRTDEEMRDMAREAVDDVVAGITATP
jgi:hypothetical protein